SGTITSGDAGNLQVIGSHTYMLAGTYSYSVLIQDIAGANATANGQTIVQILMQPSALRPVVEQSVFSGVLATFIDQGSSAADYAVTLDWGDGQESTGTVTDGGNNTWSISGAHTFAVAGNYTLTIGLQKEGAAAIMQQVAINVLDAPL